VYGIDMPSVDELVAHGRNVAEIATAIGVDRLVFQELEDLEQAVRLGNPELSHFDCSCFNGEYLTGDVDSNYLAALQRQHQTDLYTQQSLDEDTEASNVLDLHNGY
jgi:amidophosphoribosyltransferase